ncbi:unnamed protein product, partial [Ilex paraguariensis]
RRNKNMSTTALASNIISWEMNNTAYLSPPTRVLRLGANDVDLRSYRMSQLTIDLVGAWSRRGSAPKNLEHIQKRCNFYNRNKDSVQKKDPSTTTQRNMKAFPRNKFVEGPKWLPIESQHHGGANLHRGVPQNNGRFQEVSRMFN